MNGPAKRATIREVAERAGVSSATVSRVVNGAHWVSPETRAKVDAAVRQTGYTANQFARSLVTGRANSFAFLLTEQQELLFSDPTFSILLRGAAAAMGRRGMALVLLVAGTPAEGEAVLSYVSAGHVDGVMLISSHEADPLLEALVQANIPTVSCGIPLGHRVEVSSVSVDEAGSAAKMTRHLLAAGHRRIAMIAGPADTPGGRYRLEGFREAMGADFDPQLVETGDFGRASGERAMTELLSRGVPIDAVFAASDAMAVGAMAALASAGLTVPDDVAVAGFDDSGLAAEAGLTTMRQPWEAISEEMVKLLLAPRDATTRQVILPTTLVQRATA